MPVPHAELESNGKNTAGFAVPEELVDQLGGGRRPEGPGSAERNASRRPGLGERSQPW